MLQVGKGEKGRGSGGGVVKDARERDTERHRKGRYDDQDDVDFERRRFRGGGEISGEGG